MAPIKTVLLLHRPSRRTPWTHRRIISSVEGADRAFYSATMSSDARSGNTVLGPAEIQCSGKMVGKPLGMGGPKKYKATPFINTPYI